MLSLAEIIQASKGKLISPAVDLDLIQVDDIQIDSRSCNKNSLFIAINGNNQDGHDYILNVVSEIVLLENKEKAKLVKSTKHIILVDDTKQALLDLAGFYRKKLKKINIIAVTGSSGKTTIKNMLLIILQQFGETIANEGNFNNHYGVPLTIFRIKPRHKYAVVEIGANHLGEIADLVEIVKPKVTLISNIDYAHVGKFGSRQKIAEAKSEIINESCDTVVLNKEDDFFGFLENKANGKRIISFGFKQDSDFRVLKYQSNLLENSFIFKVFDKQIYKTKLTILGIHNISNANAAIAGSFALDDKIDLSLASDVLSSLQSEHGRLKKIIYKNHLIIDDSYNASPLAMKMAIDFANKNLTYPILVISDMLELGKYSEELHKNVIHGININNIKIVFSLGFYAGLIAECIKNQNSKCQIFKFKNKDLLLLKLISLINNRPKADILVKGGHATKIDEIINYFIKNN